MDATLLPWQLNVFVALNICLVTFLLAHLLARILTSFVFVTLRGKRVQHSSTELLYIRSFFGNLADAVLAPFFVILSYVTILLTFIVSNIVTVVVFGIAVYGLSYLVLAEYDKIIIFINNSYEAIISPLVGFLIFTLNLGRLAASVVVGSLNFVSNFVWNLLANAFRTIVACPGYWETVDQKSGIFYNLAELAFSASSACSAVATWLVGGLQQPLDLTGSISHLRLVYYDLVTRVECSCLADKGLLQITTLHVLDPQTNLFDIAVSEAANTVLSLVQIPVASLVALASSGFLTFEPPALGTPFQHAANAVAAAAPLADQVIGNTIRFLESVFSEVLQGRSSIAWAPVPVVAPPADVVIAGFLAAEVVFNAVPLLPALIVQGAPNDAYYKALDFTPAFNALYNASNVFWTKSFAGIYPVYLKAFGQGFADATDVLVGVVQWFTELITRFLIGPGTNAITYNTYTSYVGNTTVSGSVFANAITVCGVGSFSRQSTSSQSFSNVLVGLYDNMPRFEYLVTRRMRQAGDHVGNGFAPYYPPVRELTSFGVAYVADAVTAFGFQISYMSTSFIAGLPIDESCISTFGAPARSDADYFIQSIPDVFEFFLNPNAAAGEQVAHLNCKQYNYVNYALIGSLKSQYFLNQMCSARFANGQLVGCDFYNSSQCPTYNLAYHDYNSQPLCAFDVEAVALLEGFVNTVRLILDVAFAEVVSITNCITNGQEFCTVSSLFNPNTLNNDILYLVCTGNEIVLKGVNILGSILGLILQNQYTQFNIGTGTLSTQTSFGDSSTVHTKQFLKDYIAFKHDPSSSCYQPAAQTNAASCYRAGNCQWVAPYCTPDSGTHLAFQHHPIETGFVTMTVSFLNVVTFWPFYFGYIEMNQFLNLFSSGGLPSFNTFVNLIMADATQFVQNFITVSILGIRDPLIGFTEFVRGIDVVEFTRSTVAQNPSANVIVKNSGQFGGFFNAMYLTITVLEQLGQFVSTVLVQTLNIMGQMVVDVIGFIINPNQAEGYIKDFFEKFVKLIQSVFDDLENFIFSLPGFSKICGILQKILSFAQDVINFASGIVNAVDYVCSDCIGGIHGIDVTLSCSAGALVCAIEATPCSNNIACAGSGTFCVVESAAQCNQPAPSASCAAWGPTCPCSSLTSQDYFCNFASGFCQEGISPFQDPLDTCPPNLKADLVPSTPYFDALCMIAPVWECQFRQDPNCVNKILLNSLQGPYLCRDYCDPSAFNVDNQLIDPFLPELLNGRTTRIGCVCFVGVLAGQGQQSLLVPTARRLQQDNGQNKSPYIFLPPTVSLGVTACSYGSDVCNSPDALCYSVDGVAIPCGACSLRSIARAEDGFSCHQSRCTCERLTQEDALVRPTDAHWEGTSDCAVLGRAYETTDLTSLAPVVYVQLRRCYHMLERGRALASYFGLPFVSHATFYDPWAALYSVADTTVGLWVGVTMRHATPQAVQARVWDTHANVALALPAAELAVRHAKKIDIVENVARMLWSMGRDAIGAAGDAPRASLFAAKHVFGVGKNVATSLYKKLPTSVAEPAEELWGKLRSVGEDSAQRRRLASTALTCKLVNQASQDFTAAVNIAKIHFETNVPRAACRLSSQDLSGCPLPSWYEFAPPSPPVIETSAPPSPHVPLTTTTTGVHTTTTTGVGGTLRGVLRRLGLYQAANDLAASVNDVVTGQPDLVVQKVRSIFDSLLGTGRCDFDMSLMCLRKGRFTLFESIGIVFVVLVGGSWAIQKVFTGTLVSVFLGIVVLVLFLPHVFLLAYDVPTKCSLLPGTIPVCAVDDIFDALTGVLPRHIPWPAPVVTPVRSAGVLGTNFMTSGSVLNCHSDPYGFTSGGRWIVFALERWFPSWRKYVGELTLLVFFGNNAAASVNYYAGKPIGSAAYLGCSWVALPAVVPILFVAGLLIISSVAILHVTLVFLAAILRALASGIGFLGEYYVLLGDAEEIE